MTNITWGPEILVGGVRPAWLSKDTYFRWYGGSMGDKWWDLHSYGGVSGVGFNWEGCVDAIRLPADHFAYVAIDKGFEPWGGGDAAPADWDGGDVLWGNGNVSGAKNASWDHKAVYGGTLRIIGYRKRTETPADTVTLAKMTEADARHYFLGRTTGTNQDRFVSLLRSLDLIREETTAERFTRETGHEATKAVLAALNWERG